MAFTAELRRKADPIWRKIAGHPFVRGIGSGRLTRRRFRFYLGQDYIFLVEYSRVLALAVARAEDPKTMGEFAALLHTTLHTEMDLHRRSARRFGVSPATLERTVPAPTAYAYTRHLLQVAASGTLAELCAALLPCQWGYWELGTGLAKGQRGGRANPYGDWIRTYSGAEFGKLARWLRGLTDRLAEGAGRGERDRMRRHFLTSSRYEYGFWDMSYRMERWPL
ncbi:MAG TPA: thiaminase II [Candidatus Methylomirabilis sp.]|nr:thiaminase II [Candidatus Methylomirabilis sp.]